MPNPFLNWTQAQVDAHNARATGKRSADPKQYGDPAGTFADKSNTFQPVTDLVLIKSTDEQKLNKLERDWLRELRLTHPEVGIQDITLKLAADVRYTPDFNVVDANGQLVFYETKGKRFWDDAKVKLRVAARQWRRFRFVLVTRDKGRWLETPVPP